MSWVQDVVENMRLLRAAGRYTFEESWEVTLEIHPYRFGHGALVGQLFEADGSAPDPSVPEFMRERCREAWEGERRDLVAVADVVSELFGVDGSTHAHGRSRWAA